jgi:hypothetical protein
MATQSHVEVHKFDMFKANVQDLLGEHPAHSVMSHLCLEEMGAGRSVLIDGIDAREDAGNPDRTTADATKDSSDASTYDLQDKDTRTEFYERDAIDQTFANYLLTKTPHNGIYKIRTQSTPQLIEWGHYFDEDEGWQHLVDPKGKEVNVGVRKIHKSRDILMGLAVTAPSVLRVTNDNDTFTAVNLPPSQIIPDLYQSEINIETLPSVICSKFDNVWYAKGEPIYCAISATTARYMRLNSRSQIHSNDFVRSYENFRLGNIPEIDGVTFIVLPDTFMSYFSGGFDNWFAWCPQAITKVTYKPMKVSEGISPDHRFDTAVYAREKCDFKRTDDLGVVVGDILAGSPP